MINYLIVGLGNVGPEYADTRHNIGFMILDELAKQEKATFITERLAYYAEVSLKGRKLFLIKPTTYMNLSGKAVNYWMQTLKIRVENTLVLVDDLALPFGKLQLRPQGGHAGHNGLRNIQETLDTQNYPRLRFGIGNDFAKGQQVNYVLSGFDNDEQPELPLLIDKSMEMIKSVATMGLELTMTRMNR